ncbi:hypothetical protein [Rudaea sp.]|uniref:hypothetical protein n=1 Tax=Rudaea sp. TaxID=2136325 RepID=UPI0039E70CCB
MALPGIGAVVWLYHRWSAIGTLVLFIALSAFSLLAFCALAAFQWHSPAAVDDGDRRAADQHERRDRDADYVCRGNLSRALPRHGSGLDRSELQVRRHRQRRPRRRRLLRAFMLSAVLIAVPLALSGALLLRLGIETRGHRLDEIQAALAREGARAQASDRPPCVTPRTIQPNGSMPLCPQRSEFECDGIERRDAHGFLIGEAAEQ